MVRARVTLYSPRHSTARTHWLCLCTTYTHFGRPQYFVLTVVEPRAARVRQFVYVFVCGCMALFFSKFLLPPIRADSHSTHSYLAEREKIGEKPKTGQLGAFGPSLSLPATARVGRCLTAFWRRTASHPACGPIAPFCHVRPLRRFGEECGDDDGWHG